MPVEQGADIAPEGRDPAGVGRVQTVGQGNEGVEVGAGVRRPDPQGSVQMTPSSRPIFANASSAKSI